MVNLNSASVEFSPKTELVATHCKQSADPLSQLPGGSRETNAILTDGITITSRNNLTIKDFNLNFLYLRVFH